MSKYYHEEAVIHKAIARFFGFSFPQVGFGRHARLSTDFQALLDEMARLKLVIAGGTVISAFVGATINDLDFYMQDTGMRREVEAFLMKWFNKEEPWVSQNAITYKRKAEGSNKVYTAQLITAFSGTPEQIMSWFDFTITQGSYDFVTRNFVLGNRFLADNAKRQLTFLGTSLYPICALYRTKKYAARGYNCPGSTFMHIALSIVQLEIKTYKDLKAQLMGIDTMYLQGLLGHGKYADDLPVDYGEFVADVFDEISGVQAPDVDGDD